MKTLTMAVPLILGLFIIANTIIDAKAKAETESNRVVEMIVASK